MAFAGDDVAADFAAQKAEEAEAEAPVADMAPGTLPGWGSWASAERMQRDAEAAARKAQQWAVCSHFPCSAGRAQYQAATICCLYCCDAFLRPGLYASAPACYCPCPR